ncbi:MAG: efflux RND transporter periplasmic adaptor subunit [Anaerolineae bacterium]|nr:efflux RND transporter periplasmic adaptor subunit [Anaerolineae bacterium]
MRKWWIVITACLVALSLAACSGQVEEPPVSDLESDFVPMLSVTGKVVPAVWTSLSSQVSGTVEEVLVTYGDVVAASDLLIRLDSTDAQLAVAQAEAVLGNALAQKALVEAGVRLEQIAVAEAQVESATASLAQSSAERSRFEAGSLEAEIAAARAQVAAAQAEHRAAREMHDDTMKCYDVPQPDGTTRNVCPALGTLEEQARYNMHAAEQALEAAQAQLDALTAGVDDRQRAVNAAVWAASAQRDATQAQLDLLKAGPTDQEIAVADAAVSQARAALDAAGIVLERCEIRAPIGGTVGAVDTRIGEWIVPGQSLVTIGDLTTLRVETTDLDEIDVVQIVEGETVIVTFDALPGQTFDGRVTQIYPMASPGAGGVNYTVLIEVAEMPEQVRWGMTAFVDVEVVQ